MCLRCDGSASRALPYSHACSMFKIYAITFVCLRPRAAGSCILSSPAW